MNESPWPLNEERQRILLRNAINLIAKKEKRGVPLWNVVSTLTTNGSGFSSKICIANGWNPDQDGSLLI